ncbi:MAG: lytic murein transglycosylase, partial [Gammaproteobacteria bacterium]|nr:lytic murein transglycosylase [Gammaproteobacteria bacterium]
MDRFVRTRRSSATHCPRCRPRVEVAKSGRVWSLSRPPSFQQRHSVSFSPRVNPNSRDIHRARWQPRGWMNYHSAMFRFVPLIFILLLPLSVHAQQQTFAEWLDELRAEALALGISVETLTALNGIAPLERVLELDGSQPEFVQTFTRYIELRVTPNQIARGQALLREHAELLADVQARYGIQPHYLVAFWAIESNFGSATGGFSVLEALATLAYDPRRAEFFREQLLTALQIIDDGHIPPERMTGYWAGAMGQL